PLVLRVRVRGRSCAPRSAGARFSALLGPPQLPLACAATSHADVSDLVGTAVVPVHPAPSRHRQRDVLVADPHLDGFSFRDCPHGGNWMFWRGCFSAGRINRRKHLLAGLPRRTYRPELTALVYR